ncbi:hypothetical protein J4G63_07510 [Aeromonas sobria]|uniref:Uncharacterized protein n=1 Tax=Aeromonas sobria TaxID=646 RepID=A0A1S2CL63_AERSO|nr:hypothetical protein [Aeromonas sobria]MBS4687099.1 hypothetical protein [Aeromonas sobria]OHY88799.1 hypothetical protein BJD16_06255 [Aeromonas sobria]
MMTHFFAAFLYFVEKTLGLSKPVRSSEKPSRDGENSYRNAQSDDDKYNYQVTLDKICQRLHIGSSLSQNILSNHIDILESVCNVLVRKDIITKDPLENELNVYTKNSIIPLICTDIYIFKEQSSEESIYYHLDEILRQENLILIKEGQERFRKLTAQKYIRELIKNNYILEFCESRKYNNPELFIQELLDYLNELHKKGNQTCKTLNEKISLCQKRLSDCNLNSYNLNSISAAYTAVIILQDIDNKTGMFGHFHKTYNQVVIGSNPLLNNLKKTLRFVLDDNYDEFNEEDKALGKLLGLPPLLLVKERRIERINNVVDCVLRLFDTPLMPPFKEKFGFAKLKENLDLLSHMVYPPPAPYFYSLDIDNGHINFEHNPSENPTHANYIVFNRDYFSTIAELADDPTNQYQDYFSQYIPLLEILDSLQRALPEKALDVIDNINEFSLSTFGFNKYALAVLTIGLLYNKRASEIKNISLLPQVNDTLNHEGNISILLYRSRFLDSWLSEDSYNKHSVIFSLNQYRHYNLYLAKAIYCYNFTIARHTTPASGIHYNVFEQPLLTVDIHNLNYDSKLICHNLLERLNIVCGKVLSGLDKVNTGVDLKDPNALVNFVYDLSRAKIISKNEFMSNLIHCITDSSLGACLLDYLTLIMLFSVPGDNVNNIIKLGEKSDVVQLLFLAYEELSSRMSKK